MTDVYAHSLPGRPEVLWECLRDHLQATAASAGRHAEAFGWEKVGSLLGQLHDVGKVSREFQAYIRNIQLSDESSRGCDHSTAGARATARYHSISRLLAYAIAGHHAGLPDAERLDQRLDPARTIIPSYVGWEAHAGDAPEMSTLRPTWPLPTAERHKGFGAAFRTRMLFSCLVDADFIATEAFYAAAEGRVIERGGRAKPVDLLDRLHRFEAERDCDPSPLNLLRCDIRAHALAKAALPPGPFTLTVPTGGGKTLTSLSFALEHAARHDLRRVVYVIPYTSIIEQTAAVFRYALGTEEDVLEHHASFDWEDGARGEQGEAGQGTGGLARLRRAAENWDAPLIVTTAVQFFESLFAARTSRCRKLHNLARSVIVLDEAQNLPLRLLNPCLAALDELGRHYGTSVVLCTATQPAVRRAEDGFAAGLDLPAERELAPDPPALYAKLRRQRIERLMSPVDDAVLAARFAERSQMLCIVNSRRHAWMLFERIRGYAGAVHLSTYMCPRHRSLVLRTIKQRLLTGQAVRLVSTSLVEAGVDFSFPEVWRAEAGLDSVAQAAGRCNREGELPDLGRVTVFTPDGHTPPADLALPVRCAAGVMDRFADPLAPDAMRAYFCELYWNRGTAFFDAAMLEGKPFPILPHLAEAAADFRFDFDRIARAFRMIDQEDASVIVPWRASADDRDAETILARIAVAGPKQADLRALQRYAVPVPRRVRDEWLAKGVIHPVSPALGEALLRLDDSALYEDATGLRVFDPWHRSSDPNVIGR